MTAGKGHPLPASDEARHAEVPESLEQRKGLGDDSEEAVQPTEPAVSPGGRRYPAEPALRPRSPSD